MNKSNIILKILLFLIAFVFTFTFSKIVPKDKFDPYKLELDSIWEKENDVQEYLVDYDYDQNAEKFTHKNINMSSHSIELQKTSEVTSVFIFEYGEKFIGQYLKFADINQDELKELLFVSLHNEIAYLNILSYDFNKKNFTLLEKIKIDSLRKFGEELDGVNNFITTVGSNIYFDLQGGYAVQPRHIYKYNNQNKELIKNRLNSLVTPEVKYFNHQNHNYLLATHVRATGNTLSPKEAEMLRNSTDKDTLAIYEDLKHLEYEYGDFSSYILLYNDSLDFAFEPIEFFAWTNFTKSTLVFINEKPHIVAFTNAQMDEPEHQKSKLVTVCNLQGEIIKQIPLPYNYTDIFSINNNVIFYGEKTLFITNSNLELINKIPQISKVLGFKDINNDEKQEFIAFRDNILTIYSVDFKINATFKIEQEFAPYPEKFNFYNLKADNKNSLIFNTRLFYYKFDYIKNNISILKYPFYIAVFLLIFGILYLVFRLNSKRLEKENLKLEKIVTERTKEIASQKDEIQAQAEELKTKNEHLEELSKFKKLMTGTIIHDLKNPLNYIIGSSKDKSIRQSGYNMLNIVLNILDINKAQTTNLNVEIEKQNIENLINSSIEQIEYLADQKNLKIYKTINKEISINADKDLTVRILVNLLTNAIKFSPLNNKITFQVTEDGKFAKIDITDYGKGILPENIDKLFDQYSQFEAKKSGKVKSTGLGLTFCKIATESQKAQINVSSIPNEKTTFTLIFPVVSVNEKTSKIEQKTENDNFLTDEERKELKHILLNLKEIETYRATEVLKLLNSIENSSQNIKLWKQKLTTAMYAMNDELYQKLIENEL